MNRSNRLKTKEDHHQNNKHIGYKSKPVENKSRTVEHQNKKKSQSLDKLKRSFDTPQQQNIKMANKKYSKDSHIVFKKQFDSSNHASKKMTFQSNNKLPQVSHKNSSKQMIQTGNNRLNLKKAQSPKIKPLGKKSYFQNHPPRTEIITESNYSQSSQPIQENEIKNSNQSKKNFYSRQLSQNNQIQQPIRCRERLRKKDSSDIYDSKKSQKYIKQRHSQPREKIIENNQQQQKALSYRNSKTRKEQEIFVAAQRKRNSRPSIKNNDPPYKSIFHHKQDFNPKATKRYHQQQQKRLKQFQQIIKSKKQAFDKINKFLDIKIERHPLNVQFDMMADRVIKGSYRNYQSEVDRVNKQQYGFNIINIDEVIREIEQDEQK